MSRPFPSWSRSMLTEIYLCHACTCHAILRAETAGQALAIDRPRYACVRVQSLATTPDYVMATTEKDLKRIVGASQSPPRYLS
eukprot:COSAG01_NODE_10611_length_2122_cov_4.310924_2_plen_83_part_00